jgi:hypothetical protein
MKIAEIETLSWNFLVENEKSGNQIRDPNCVTPGHKSRAFSLSKILHQKF